MPANPLLSLRINGKAIGLWRCIMAFHANHRLYPDFNHIPHILPISRNPKLRSFPSLANDLQVITKLRSRADGKDQFPSEVEFLKNREDDHQPKKIFPVLDQDLNCLPHSIDTSELSMNGRINQNALGQLVNMGNCMLRSASNDTTSGTRNGSQFSGALSDGYEESKPGGQILEAPNLKVFTFADLKSATNNFKPEAYLGEGGSGCVFKGWIDERTLNPSKSGLGMIVAIKVLNPESTQGFDEGQSELNFLGSLSHPNMVKLLGYCWEEKKLLFVYEFLQKGSLEDRLFRRNRAVEPLSWELRLKIAIGAAHGLAFLHTLEKQVIYRDFKASNILLDTNYNAKISDFRLARLGPSAGYSHVTTRVMGTYGYTAPEYSATGHLSVKSDVYGFGVVLLEMMTGLRAFHPERPAGKQNLADWLKPVLSHERKLRNIMDKTMEGQYSSKAMLQAAQLASRCLAVNPKHRPSMKEVLEVLKYIYGIKQKPKDSTKSTSAFTNS